MSLGRRLKAISDGLTAQDPESSAILHGIIDDLRASGAAERALKEGDTAPDFSLVGTEGDVIRLEALVRRRPAILTFYRGRW
jgi:hypothetical protein